MDSNGAPHLSDEQLTSPSAAAHLEHCAECAARLRDWNAAAAAYAECRDSVRGPQLPAAPKPWRTLDRLVADHRAARRQQLLGWWWAPALAAALVLAIVTIRRPAEQSSARASQLLARAALAPRARDRMISLRAHGRALLRPAVLAGDAPAGDPGMAHLQTLFHAAHYGWQDPLSPRTFQAWRGAQNERRDSVVRIAQPGQAPRYRVRTDVPAGVLRSASLTLREEDLRPTGADFDFAGEGPVSMEEAPPPAEPAPPRLPAAKEAPLETPLSPGDTLRVLAALDEIGADAGEPVEVAQDAPHGRVVVHAGSLSPERQRQIAAALALLPRVTLDLASGPARATPVQPAAPQTGSSSIPPGMRQRFEDRLGGPIALQEITDRTLEASAQVLGRAHALEVLAASFPPETEARLNAGDRLLLDRLRRRHMAELARLAAQIRNDLKPLLEAQGAAPQGVGDNGRGLTWQAGIPSLVASARKTDRLLNDLLAGSYSSSSGEDMLRSLAASIERLEWNLQQP